MSLQPDLLQPAESAEPKLHVTTHGVRDLLRRRYEAPEWALLEEVAPNTGGGTRYADAIAVNLWSSRGHTIHGFEIKVSRSDWLRELKDPAKADTIAGFCDHWWIVAPRGMVREAEMPPTWGLIEVRASGLVISRQAPRLEARPITRGFFASLVRRAFEAIDKTAERKIVEVRAAVNDEVRRLAGEQSRALQVELDALRKHLANLKDETGIDICRYSGPPKDVIKLAQRLQALQGYGDGRPFHALENLASSLEQSAATVRDALAELDQRPANGGEHPTA